MTSWSAPDESEDVEDAARSWYLRLVSGEARRADITALEDWLARDGAHDAAFRRVRAVYGAAAEDPLAIARRVEARARRRRNNVVAAAACVIAVVAVGMPSPARMFADHTSKTGEVRRLQLPDGTVAFLDTYSAIDVDFDASSRTVTLKEGRAWFDVAHTPLPFRVKAVGGEVTDIGTAFSVGITSGGGLDVGVQQGVVDVRYGGVTRRLSQGMDGRFEAGAPSNVTAASPSAFDWRGGRLSFDGRPLSEVLAEIDRYRPGVIYLADKAIAGRRVSAILSIDALDSGLESLADNQHLKLRQVSPWLTIVSSTE